MARLRRAPQLSRTDTLDHNGVKGRRQPMQKGQPRQAFEKRRDFRLGVEAAPYGEPSVIWHAALDRRRHYFQK